MDLQNKIFEMCNAAGFRVALSKLIVCQAIHETANFTSNVFRENNNLFGYSAVAGAKWQNSNVNTGRNDGGVKYAYYDKVENSINEIIDYYKRRIREDYLFNIDNLTPSRFASELKRAHYYTDLAVNYERGLRNAYDKILKTEIKITLDGVTVSLSKKKICSCCGRPF